MLFLVFPPRALLLQVDVYPQRSFCSRRLRLLGHTSKVAKENLKLLYRPPFARVAFIYIFYDPILNLSLSLNAYANQIAGHVDIFSIIVHAVT